MMGFELNPEAVEFCPVTGHPRGKRAIWRWTSVSKQQIRHAGGDEGCGRRRVGLLNPLGGDTRKLTDIDVPNLKSETNVFLVWFGLVPSIL